MHEIELKYQVGPDHLALLRAWLDQRAAAPARVLRLRASYVDTETRALARAGLALRVRREGTRWVQTLKGRGADAVTRLEHNVVLRQRAAAVPVAEPALHRGTPVGEVLAQVLAQDAGTLPQPLAVVYQTEVRRSVWEVSGSHGVVEVALDLGHILAGDRRLDIRELEIERVHGEAAVFALATQVLAQFPLWLDLRSKAERGLRLADGVEGVAARRADPVVLPRSVDVVSALRHVVAEVLEHGLLNAQELSGGTGTVEHLHQLRVSLRRARTAFRLFGAAVPFSLADWSRDAAELFRQLGAARDADALRAAISPALQAAGAPVWDLPLGEAAQVDVPALLHSGAVQQLWLQWTAFAHGLTPPPAAGITPEPAARPKAETTHEAMVSKRPKHPVRARAHVERQLRKWWRQVRRDARRFEGLDEAQIHQLRKRIKRLRYASDFAASWYPRRSAARQARRLGQVQDILGELTDVMTALPLYQQWAEQEPAARFAVGWLQARREHLRERAQASTRAWSTHQPMWG